jgi:hypothetical protein
MATGTFDCDASDQDGYQDDDGSDLNTTALTWRVRASTSASLVRDGMLVFSSVTIPQGATIVSADIDFDVNSASFDDIGCVISGDDADNSAIISGLSDISGRTRTTANVAFTRSGMGTGAETTPDITTIVQEIVNRGSWASGNRMGIIFDGNTSGSENFRGNAFDNGSTVWSQLNVEWTVGQAWPVVNRQPVGSVVNGGLAR